MVENLLSTYLFIFRVWTLVYQGLISCNGLRRPRSCILADVRDIGHVDISRYQGSRSCRYQQISGIQVMQILVDIRDLTRVNISRYQRSRSCNYQKMSGSRSSRYQQMSRSRSCRYQMSGIQVMQILVDIRDLTHVDISRYLGIKPYQGPRPSRYYYMKGT